MEPSAGRFTQFRSELEIIMGTYRADVTKVGSQMGQLGLDIQTLGIPAF
jgi:hypothetical protein